MRRRGGVVRGVASDGVGTTSGSNFFFSLSSTGGVVDGVVKGASTGDGVTSADGLVVVGFFAGKVRRGGGDDVGSGGVEEGGDVGVEDDACDWNWSYN